MRDLLQSRLRFAAEQAHIWWGVSVENREYGLPRIKHLRATAASVRFLSIEPLLEDMGSLDLSGIHWVIVGGESGHSARPMQKQWVISIQRQCERKGVAFFFKKWGGGHKSKAGRLLEGRTYDEMPTAAPDVSDGAPNSAAV
jgi:protein gp37